MSTEAMKLALEALEGSTDKTLSTRALTALREALAQPQLEPVRVCNPVDCQYIDGFGKIDCDWCRPKASPPAQEFVCSTGLCHYRKPLTDAQIENIAAQTLFPVAFARAIEAAHGIKGEA